MVTDQEALTRSPLKYSNSGQGNVEISASYPVKSGQTFGRASQGLL
jgi:hypothetical protein